MIRFFVLLKLDLIVISIEVRIKCFIGVLGRIARVLYRLENLS